jgi:hypothetical protein
MQSFQVIQLEVPSASKPCALGLFRTYAVAEVDCRCVAALPQFTSAVLDQ